MALLIHLKMLANQPKQSNRVIRQFSSTKASKSGDSAVAESVPMGHHSIPMLTRMPNSEFTLVYLWSTILFHSLLRNNPLGVKKYTNVNTLI